MQIREAIENMRGLATIHRNMVERIAMSDPTLYDIESGIKYQEMAANEDQIAGWLEELEVIKSYDIPMKMKLHDEEIIKNTIGNCVDILSEYVDCPTRPINCRGYIKDGCKDSLRSYLQEELEWRRTTMLPGGSLEREIRRKTIDEFVEKLCEYFPDNSERVHFEGHTCDILTLDNALDCVSIVAESMKGDK